MSDIKIIGKVGHYASGESVHFSFEKEAESGKIPETAVSSFINLPFEIWKKFKNSKVEIIIKKVE